MKYYEFLAEVLLAVRPVLKTTTPRKDLLALEAVWQGTVKRVAKAEDEAEPVFEKLRSGTAKWDDELKGEVLPRLLRWEGKRECQRQRWADLQWTALVGENAVTEVEAVCTYLLDLRNIVLDDRLQEPIHLQLDAVIEIMESIEEGSDPADVDLPVIGVVEEDWGCADQVLGWKPLNQFNAADFHAIAEWYEGQIGRLFDDKREYDEQTNPPDSDSNTMMA